MSTFGSPTKRVPALSWQVGNATESRLKGAAASHERRAVPCAPVCLASQLQTASPDSIGGLRRKAKVKPAGSSSPERRRRSSVLIDVRAAIRTHKPTARVADGVRRAKAKVKPAGSRSPERRRDETWRQELNPNLQKPQAVRKLVDHANRGLTGRSPRSQRVPEPPHTLAHSRVETPDELSNRRLFSYSVGIPNPISS